MNSIAAPNSVRAALPELAARLMAILGTLGKVIAAEMLHRPHLVGFISSLYVRLIKIGTRFATVRVPPVARQSRAGELRPAPAEPATRKPPVRLPSSRGWLVKALGYRVTPYASQLAHLLDQPEMRAVIDAAPGFGRILRPICWMLGVSRAKATATTELKRDLDGALVPHPDERPLSRPGKMRPIVLIYPPVEPEPPPALGWVWGRLKNR